MNTEYNKGTEGILFELGTTLIVLGSLASITYFGIRDNYKKQSENQPKTLQIKSFEDRDNAKGYDTIISEDGRTFQIEERNGKLSLLEKSLEKIK